MELRMSLQRKTLPVLAEITEKTRWENHFVLDSQGVCWTIATFSSDAWMPWQWHKYNAIDRDMRYLMCRSHLASRSKDSAANTPVQLQLTSSSLTGFSGTRNKTMCLHNRAQPPLGSVYQNILRMLYVFYEHSTYEELRTQTIRFTTTE